MERGWGLGLARVPDRGTFGLERRLRSRRAQWPPHATVGAVI